MQLSVYARYIPLSKGLEAYLPYLLVQQRRQLKSQLIVSVTSRHLHLHLLLLLHIHPK